jgi:hypothetical protein
MKSLKNVVLAIGLSASLFALVASGETSGTTDSGSSDTEQSSGSDSGKKNAPEDDVEIATCGSNELGWPEAQVKITNNSSKASNYIVEIVFESADGSTQIDTSMVAVNSLAPGQSATEDAVTFGEASGDFVCKVADVTRYAS